jgi:predicted type IV restriction endonuclease
VYSKAGFLDYELSRGIPLLVFEAKAEGEAFVIPYRKRAGAQSLKISGSLEKNKTIRAALEQTHDYCGDRGIRYGVTTNGYSFIIFRAITEGVS